MTDKMFYLKKLVQNTALTTYMCTFEYSAVWTVWLVCIIIKYLFQIKLTFIGLTNKILMNKLFKNIKLYNKKLIIIILYSVNLYTA